MKLYHISNSTELVKEFIPRVPDSAALEEDSDTPRICLSDSIGGCLTAVKWGGAGFYQNMLTMEDGTERSIILTLYEFDIPDTSLSLIPPSSLYYRNLVNDALVTHEYWYTANLKPSSTTYIQLTSYHESGVSILGEPLEKDFTGELDDVYISLDDIQYDIISPDSILYDFYLVTITAPPSFIFDTSPYGEFDAILSEGRIPFFDTKVIKTPTASTFYGVAEPDYFLTESNILSSLRYKLNNHNIPYTVNLQPIQYLYNDFDTFIENNTNTVENSSYTIHYF